MNANQNILSERYATKEMNAIFSEEGKILAERELWIAIMKAQKELGLDIPSKDIEKFESAMDNIDLDQIAKIELKTKHDVTARIEAFILAAGAGQYVHVGMTSRDLTDNVEQMQARKASQLIFGKCVSVLRHFADKAQEYKDVVISARTHHQPAQPTLLGRRICMWGEELFIHVREFEKFIERYPLRGIKGPVGTQSDMLSLLHDEGNVAMLEKRVSNLLGFAQCLDSPGQVYPRSLDQGLLSRLSEISSPCANFAITMRLMAGEELVTEGFTKHQKGSSAMPHKMNTPHSERIVGFSKLLKMYAAGAGLIAGDQWEEGDVSCSVVRRVILPDAFYAADGLCETTLSVLNEMGVYKAMIRNEVDRYLPFLASTKILSFAVKAGMGREDAHAVIKRHAVDVAKYRRTVGTLENDMLERLAKDPQFQHYGISRNDLEAIFSDQAGLVGLAHEHMSKVCERINQLVKEYPAMASYEPRPIR